jgi:hypothetical protein
VPDHGLISGAGVSNLTVNTAQWVHDSSAVTVSGGNDTASAQTAYGSNHAASATTNGLAYAGSLWWDQYTISGGSGSGSADFLVALNGSLTASGSAAAAVGYVLFVVDTLPTYLDVDFSTLTVANISPWLSTEFAAAVPGANVLAAYASSALSGNTEVNQSFAGQVGFTYGNPFYIGAALVTASAGNAGSADFMNSADFSLQLASGDTLVAASVPEPGEWIMLLVGLGLVAWRLAARHRD